MVERERQQDRLLIVTAGLHAGTLGGSCFNIRPQPGEALEASASLQSTLTRAVFFNYPVVLTQQRLAVFISVG